MIWDELEFTIETIIKGEGEGQNHFRRRGHEICLNSPVLHLSEQSRNVQR